MRLQNLSALLGRYVPADAREAGFRERMRALMEAGGEHAFARDHVRPGHFTASAFIVSPERDALLLIFHRKLSRWLQPGGHVEPGDPSILAAARREVAEEVGLRDLSAVGGEANLFDVDIHEIPARGDESGHEHFDVRFLFQAKTRTFHHSDEVAGAEWVPFTSIAARTSDESVLRAVRKIG